MNFNAEILRDLFAQRIKAIAPHLEDRLAENAQRPFKVSMRSNGVAHRAGLQQTKLQRAPGALGGVKIVKNLFCTHDKAGCGKQGIRTVFAFGDVSAFAFNVNRDFARCGKERPRTGCRLSERQIRPKVKAVNGLHVLLRKNAGLADELSAARRFFSRLENQQNILL